MRTDKLTKVDFRQLALDVINEEISAIESIKDQVDILQVSV